MANNFQRLMLYAAIFFADLPKIRPSEWCAKFLRFDEPGNRGPYTTAGREYIIEPLDDWARMDVADCVEVFGSQTGKTGMLMGGAAWSIVNDPCGLLWVMPSINLAQSFSKTRWQPMLRASEVTREMIPTRGRARHDFTKLEQHLGASVLNFVGSNSAANLASRPARRVILDEVDKFDAGGREEADAVNLAEQRTKGQAYPQRRKTSTPTLVSGLIWQQFLKGDQRRYFVPCPHCNKDVVFAWSKEFTVLTKTGAEAFIRWDAEAKKENGEWDLERVLKSARAECPHCQGHILDGHKTRMVARGQWRATAKAELGFRSRQLSSLYASSPETTFGKLAVKFLKDKRSLTGLQGFINGDLAEPYQAQDQVIQTLEMICPADAPAREGSAKLLTADYQLLSPHLWYVVGEVTPDKTRVVDFGSLDTFEDLEEKQKDHAIPNHRLGIDCGHHPDDVFTACLHRNRGKLVQRGQGQIPLWVGWLPMRGDQERRAFYHQAKSRIPTPFMLGAAQLPHRKFELGKLEFIASHLKDILERVRKGRTDHKLEFSAGINVEEFLLHLNAEYKKPEYRDGRLRYKWVAKRGIPNHGLDCVTMLFTLAMFHKILPWSEIEQPKTK